MTAEGTLLAAPFDLRRLALTGPAVAMIDSVGRKNQDYMDLAVSLTGRLVYLPSSAACVPTQGIPVWVERGGRETAVEQDWSVGVAASGLALSPDGSTLAITRAGAAGECWPDIWLKKLPGGSMFRLTSPPVGGYHPFWSPDGRMVGFTSAFTSAGIGRNRLWQRRSDGSGDVDSLLAMEGGGGVWGGSWSSDGAWLLASRNLPGGGVNVIALRPGRDSVPLEVVSSTFNPVAQTMSPDGKWLAYSSSETGRREIFVRPFPEVGGGKWQVSLDGGEYPKWSRQGSELFYSANRKWSTASGSNEEFFGVASGDLMVARVRTSPTFEVIDRSVFVPALKDPSRYGYYWDYDVHPDGKRLLMVRLLLKENAARSRLVVVENFFEELKAKVPR